LNYVHEYFKGMDYSFSFLTTNFSLVAYPLYRKLGYEELLESRSAYKLVKKISDPEVSAVTLGEINIEKLLKIYNDYVKVRTGFVIRDKSHMLMLEKSEGPSSLRCILEDDGYLILKNETRSKQLESTCIKELVAINSGAMRILVRLAEDQSRNVVYDRAIIDDSLFQIYRFRRYMVQSRSNVVIMVKSLEKGLSAKEVYGDRFFVAGLDFPKK
jgi:predicted acetyltransferase